MKIQAPGDFVDLQSLYLPVMDHAVAAIVSSTVAFVPHLTIPDVDALKAADPT